MFIYFLNTLLIIISYEFGKFLYRKIRYRDLKLKNGTVRFDRWNKKIEK